MKSSKVQEHDADLALRQQKALSLRLEESNKSLRQQMHEVSFGCILFFFLSFILEFY